MIKTKIINFFSGRRISSLLLLVALIALSSAGPLYAQAVTQGYGSDGNLQRGMLVSIKPDDSTKVEATTIATADKLHGVIVDANDAPVTLSAEGQKVFVATVGKYQVLVNNIGGQIKPGDYISVSPLAGIGMKADDKQPYVIGKALDGFDSESTVVGTTKLDDRDIAIGRVTVDVLAARNPLQKPVSNLPEFLRETAENIAGKPVNGPRIYLSLTIFILSSFVSANLLYSGVRNGIISIGRNPLSKKSIIRGMLQVVIVGVTIFISGIFGVYLLLKL